jgi:hypothetical protein
MKIMEAYDYKSKYDTQFDNSSYIKFYPFIGKYYNCISPKVMVLGESLYINPNIPDKKLTNKLLTELNNDIYLTRYVFVDDYFPEIRPNGTHPYQWIRCYRYTAAMITGKDYHFSEHIWDYLSFYNFFQTNVGKGSKGKEYISIKIIQIQLFGIFLILPKAFHMNGIMMNF